MGCVVGRKPRTTAALEASPFANFNARDPPGMIR